MIAEIIEGIRQYFQAYTFARKHRLMRYFLIPSLISLILGLSILYVSIRLSKWMFVKIEQWLAADFFERFNWIENTLQYAGSILTVLLILVPMMFILKYLVIIINGPFMSPLSEKVEKIIYGDIGGPSFSIQQLGYGIFRGINYNLRLIIGELLLTILLYIVTLPVAAATPFILLLVQSYFAGRGNMDYVLERYYRLGKSLQFSKANKGIAIGNGLPFVMLLYIPIIGFMLAPPLSTIAVTIETLKKIKSSENNLEPDR